jgi:putative ATP-dependent endonuclease of OLD family
VLFEGETEEQALPLFAQRHWNRHPFEIGVAFVGVGGDGNYAPFLRTLDAIGIPWFIFSDGEPKARDTVTAALQKVGAATNHPHVITLPNNRAIEGYLLDEGYQNEIRQAVIGISGPYHSTQHEQAKRKEVGNQDNAKLLETLLQNKTKMASHWAEAILRVEGDRCIPRAIRDLLQKIDTVLSTNAKQDTE